MCDNCSCSTNDTAKTESFPVAEGSLRTFQVVGMTCDHCKRSVTEEVEKVAGVMGIEVDVPSGKLSVTGDVDDEAIKAAVEEAGYQVSS